MTGRLLLLPALPLLLAGCGHKTIYADGCGAIPAYWVMPRQGRSVLSTFSLLAVAANGSLVWNGTPISRAKLVRYLQESATLNPRPALQVKFDPGLDCATVSDLRKLVDRAADCAHGRCAEGNGHWWLISDVGSYGEVFDPATRSGADPITGLAKRGANRSASTRN